MSRLLWLLLLAFVLLTVVGALTRVFGLELVSIDAASILVLHVALARSNRTLGGADLRFHGRASKLFEPQDITLVLLIGYMADVLGGATKGLHGLALACVYLGGRVLSRRLSIRSVGSQVMIGAVASLTCSTVALCLRWVGGVEPGLGIVAALLSQALLTGLASPPLIFLAELGERALDRRPSAKSSLRI